MVTTADVVSAADVFADCSLVSEADWVLAADAALLWRIADAALLLLLLLLADAIQVATPDAVADYSLVFVADWVTVDVDASSVVPFACPFQTLDC